MLRIFFKKYFIYCPLNLEFIVGLSENLTLWIVTFDLKKALNLSFRVLEVGRRGVHGRPGPPCF